MANNISDSFMMCVKQMTEAFDTNGLNNDFKILWSDWLIVQWRFASRTGSVKKPAE